MAAKPKTIDEYLAVVSADKRVALEKLRKTIKAIVPKAEECISYGLAAFRLDGKPLVGFAACANHCSFYPWSGSTVKDHKDELKDYVTTKGSIHFHADKPLPVALVRKLIRARIAENDRRSGTANKPYVAARKRFARPEPTGSQTDPAVSAFLRELDHPLKREIEAVRQIILGVSSKIREGIKWNAPSFRTRDYFATVNLRAKGGETRVWLILHTGAKVKKTATAGIKIADPAGLLQWLGKDRCLVTFGDGKDIQAKRAALEAIIHEWIQQL